MKKLIVISLLLSACGQQGSNGPKGDQGIPGTPGTVVTAQPFCPSLTGGIGFQEQYMIIDGKAYAVYYDGSHTFLAYLKPGNYVTTDGRNCHFTVNNDGSVI